MLVNPFSANVPLTDKPGSWLLLAKCLKNNCGGVTFSPASLLKMSLFHRCYSNILLGKTNCMVSARVEHWSKMG